MQRRTSFRWACAAGALLASAPAWSQVLISPVVVEMAGRSRPSVVSVTLSDKATKPARLQAQVLTWEQGLGGEAVTRPTDDLVVSPVLADLKPGQKQIFRVMQRNGTPAAREKAYRLILEDVAETPAEEASMAIRFRMRYDLAVLVAPAGKPVAALQWSPCAPSAAPSAAPSPKSPQACVHVVNAGNHRVKLESLDIEGAGWREHVGFNEGTNVLAGAEREWRVAIPAQRDATVTAVSARTVQGEKLTLDRAR